MEQYEDNRSPWDEIAEAEYRQWSEERDQEAMTARLREKPVVTSAELFLSHQPVELRLPYFVWMWEETDKVGAPAWPHNQHLDYVRMLSSK